MDSQPILQIRLPERGSDRGSKLGGHSGDNEEGGIVKKTDIKLINIVRRFRSGLLKKDKANGMCFAVSCALAGYLSFLGYDCAVTMGTVEDWNH